MISVVIPTRNRRPLLLRTLRSALAQRDVAVHVIVVDDGSDDDTADVLQRTGDTRVTVIRNSAPLGVSAARNAGIAAATGDWVAFLDDDDLWSPYKLIRQLQTAESDNCAWACSGSVTFVGDGNIVAGESPPSGDVIASTLPSRNCVPAGASNVVVRRDLLHTVGRFDTALRHMADWDMWMRLVAFGPPAVVQEPAVAYRLHESNASAESEEMEREIAILEHRHTPSNAVSRVDRAFVYRWSAWNLLRAGKRREALSAYARAVSSGDLLSIVRGVSALIDPGIARRNLARHAADEAWAARARVWLQTANADETALHARG